MKTFKITVTLALGAVMISLAAALSGCSTTATAVPRLSGATEAMLTRLLMAANHLSSLMVS